MMTSREQFEAWVSGQYPWEPMEDILLKVGPEKERYYLKLIQSSWEAWQASREAVEVQLPDRRDYEETLSDHELGFNIALELCAEAIRAAGIKVKGE
ncbi:hypothetical protein ACM55O_08785 [Hafnia paralvei]|uniref:hypothetical protein n=1 Tax=Hafnia paralvei TaxID=546367 RepID=UPI0039FC4E8C